MRHPVRWSCSGRPLRRGDESNDSCRAAEVKASPWERKADRAYWRGGISKDEPLRSRLIHCPHSSALGHSSFDLQASVRTLAASE